MSSNFTLFVDLDGTITEPSRGMIEAFRYAFAQMNVAVAPHDDLRWLIGPPLRTVLPKLGVAPENIERCVALYREKYTGGLMHDVDVFDGIADALRTLRAEGFRLFVCTSKPHAYARPIVERIGLMDTFENLHGAELDGVRDNKGDLIAWMLALYDLKPENVIMIGDTQYDVEGARLNGVRSVGVTWGHGEERLKAANPDALCERPVELPAIVRRLAGIAAHD